MVKIISISDEVYQDLSRIKDGKSFTELLKTLVTQCTNKGDPKSILTFIDTHEPLNNQAATAIQTATEKGRKTATPRKSATQT